MVDKAQRYGYLPTPFKTLDELRQRLDETLFHSSRYNSHRPKDTSHKFCQRAHDLTLPSDVGSTAQQNFIPRMLFTDMHWSIFSLQMIMCMFCTFHAYIFCYVVTQVPKCVCYLCNKESLTYLLTIRNYLHYLLSRWRHKYLGGVVRVGVVLCLCVMWWS